MTSNFDSHNSNDQPSSAVNPNRSHSLNVMQRDRFEMLSAYLDGEVSADERRQVEEWLANDPTVQRLHARLLNLRQAFQTMSVPLSDQSSVQQTVDAVLARVDRKPRLPLIWGGIAIAAVAIGAISSVLLGERSPLPQMASTTNQEHVQPSQTPTDSEMPLLVAIDEPIASLPKGPMSPSELNQGNPLPSQATDTIR
ncbi:MAG: Fis family transcriptional regulator [Leptolyngbyaceae cyanobacterium RU_5_1]|nr:Fis family transcriptional regulator [Leptolyngbyaceae cyanobacterium RU_5_1]